MTQRQLEMNVVNVPATISTPADIAGLHQIVHDRVRRALRDLRAVSYLTETHPRLTGHAHENPGVVRKEGPATHLATLTPIS